MSCGLDRHARRHGFEPSYVRATTRRIASAARRLAPGRRAARARAPGRRECAPRARDRSASTIASRRDRLRRERVLHQLRHDLLAGDQVDHADRVDRHEPPQPAGTSAATRGRRSPSACRAAPSGRSRCRTRSARRPPTRAPRRSRLRRRRQRAAEPPAPTTSNSRRRGAARARRRTARRGTRGADALGGRQQVRQDPRHFVRPAARQDRHGRRRRRQTVRRQKRRRASPTAPRDRPADGRRTRPARRRRDRSPPRTERSPAPDRQSRGSSSAGPRRHAQICGLM